MTNKSSSHFRELLDATYNWPAEYSFKFIVPIDSINELLVFFPKDKVIKKPSSQGNYISITVTRMIQSTDEILELYQKISSVKKIISL